MRVPFTWKVNLTLNVAPIGTRLRGSWRVLTGRRLPAMHPLPLLLPMNDMLIEIPLRALLKDLSRSATCSARNSRLVTYLATFQLDLTRNAVTR